MPKKSVSLVQVRKGPKTLQPLQAIELMKKSKSRFLAVPRNRKDLVNDKRNWYFIRNKEGEKIGTVSIHPETAEIGGFSLLSEHRGLQNAVPALRSAENILKKLGHKKVMVRVSVSSQKTIKALKFLGYKTKRKLVKQKYGIKFDLVELQKQL